MLVSVVRFLWKVKSAPSSAARSNLKSDARKYSLASATIPLHHITKHGSLLATAKRSGADFTYNGRHLSLTSTQFINKMELMWGVHNTRLLPWNKMFSRPMCGQFINNGDMAGNFPSMTARRQDRHSSALQLMLSLLNQSNGGRWETITTDFANKPSKQTVFTSDTFS
jgi:hypothetical protein